MAKCVECGTEYPDKSEPYMCADCSYVFGPTWDLVDPKDWDREDPDPENDDLWTKLQAYVASEQTRSVQSMN